jgi:hypothetical protein
LDPWSLSIKIDSFGGPALRAVVLVLEFDFAADSGSDAFIISVTAIGDFADEEDDDEFS